MPPRRPETLKKAEKKKIRKQKRIEDTYKPSAFCLLPSAFYVLCSVFCVLCSVFCVLCSVFCFLPSPAWGWNTLPLAVESPYTIPGGTVQFELGCGFLGHKNFGFSNFSEHFHRDVLSWPTLGLNIGLGKRVEFQMSYEVLFVEEDELRIKERWKSGDLAFFTKINLLQERTWLPGIGVKLGAKLPNASNVYRVGTDEADLAFLAITEKTVDFMTLNAHVGLLILGNPYALAQQDDLLAYGIAGNLPITTDVSARLEVAGQTLGTAHNEAASAIGRILLDQKRMIWNLSGRVGLLPNSESWGISGGLRINIEFEALAEFFTP
jgi:hypothetical protein